MESLVGKFQKELEALGEYVVTANIDWFAVFQSTLKKRMESARRAGREGPNLIIYRTKSDEARDHYVIPFAVVRELLIEDTLADAINGSVRWNLIPPFKNGKLRVTHLPTYKVDVSKYYGARLLVETDDIPTAVSLLPADKTPADQILEGIAHEVSIIVRGRSQRLRQLALKRANGTCEACATDFTELLDGRGLRVLQVHHKQQLALQDEPKLASSDDLAVVCANCHVIIHSDPKNAMPVNVLREQWAKQNG